MACKHHPGRHSMRQPQAQALACAQSFLAGYTIVGRTNVSAHRHRRSENLTAQITLHHGIPHELSLRVQQPVAFEVQTSIYSDWLTSYLSFVNVHSFSDGPRTTQECCNNTGTYDVYPVVSSAAANADSHMLQVQVHQPLCKQPMPKQPQPATWQNNTRPTTPQSRIKSIYASMHASIDLFKAPEVPQPVGSSPWILGHSGNFLLYPSIVSNKREKCQTVLFFLAANLLMQVQAAPPPPPQCCSLLVPGESVTMASYTAASGARLVQARQ